MAGGVAAPVASAQQAPAQSSQSPASPMVQQMQAQSSMQNPYANQQMNAPMQYGMPQQMGGLQYLMSRLANTSYQQPQARYNPMPQYNNQALGYRPNMGMAQQNLGRTAGAVAAAQAAAAEKKAQLEQQTADQNAFSSWQRQQYQNYLRAQSDSGIGGG